MYSICPPIKDHERKRGMSQDTERKDRPRTRRCTRRETAFPARIDHTKLLDNGVNSLLNTALDPRFHHLRALPTARSAILRRCYDKHRDTHTYPSPETEDDGRHWH
jgi:hypothetical protein